MKQMFVVTMTLCAWFATSPAAAADETMKIFLLLGQSNMEGQAYTYDSAATAGWNIPTMEFLLSGTPAASNYLANMPFGFKDSLHVGWLDPRDDVWAVHYYSGDGSVKDVQPSNDPADIVSGIQPLMPGFGVGTGNGSMFGAELGMGVRLGDALDAPVFLFKSDRGGTTLGNDWRPPTAVAARGGVIGPEYANTIIRFIEFLDGLDADLADDGVLNNYRNATGYTVSAVFWLQGWNEQFDDAPYTADQLKAEYTDNLKDLIHSIRAADRRIPHDLPLIIGESSDQNATLNSARRTAVTQLNAEIANTAAFFDTANMKGVDWGNNDSGVPFSQNWGYHFHARAENFLEIGWKAAGVVLDNGYTLPLRLVEPGVSSATATSATVRVTINTNADEVVLYWGATDQSASPTGWAGARSLGAWTGALGEVSGTLTGLVADTVYTFRAWATNTLLTAEAWSHAAVVPTHFAATHAPSNLAASVVNPGQIDLAWEEGFNTETGHLVRCADDNGFTVNVRDYRVGPGVTTFSDAFASPNSTYYYRVAALNDYGQSAFSAVASATTPGGPTAGLVGYWPMDNTRGTELTDHTATANHGAFVQGHPRWVEGKFGNALDIFATRLDRASIPHHAAYIAANAYTFSFWINSSTGYRRHGQIHKGWNKVMLGASNNNAQWSKFGSPWANTYLGFPWSDQVWHHIVVSYDAAETYAKRLYVDGTLLASNTTAGVGSDSALNTDPINLSAAADHYKFSGLIDDLAVWDRAITPSEIAYLYSGGAGNIVAGLNAPPTAPTNVSASASTESVILSWAPNSVDRDVAGYSVYRGAGTGGPYARLASNLTSATYTDTGLVNGTPYYYVIRSFDVRGAESGNSPEATATPVVDATPPAAPKDVSAQPGWRRIYLSWPANTEPDLSGYFVYRGLAPGGPFAVVTTLVTVTSFADEGLTNGVATYYRLTAEDLVGNESVPSDVVSATPQVYDSTGNLVGYWPMDDWEGTNLTDVTTNANHGRVTAGTPEWQPGKFGNALEFVQADKEKAVIDGLTVYRAGKAFTIAFWINQVRGYRCQPFISNGIKIHDYKVNEFGTPWTSTDTGFRNDQLWHHIAFVFDPYDAGGYGKRLYVDGTVLASNIAYDTDSMLSGSQMTLSGAPTYAWSGKLDDLAVWDRALPRDAIESLWNDGDGRPAYIPSSPPEGSLLIVR